MTKARDLSKIIGAGGIIDNSKITLDANEIPNISTDKLTSGTIPNARLPATALNSNVDLTTLSASNLTSGTVADARIPNLNASKITAGTIASARLGSGTASSSTFLRGDGTFAEAGGGDLVKLATTTVSSAVSSISFDGLFSSTYKKYQLIGTGLLQSGNNTNCYLRVRQSNSDVTGSSYIYAETMNRFIHSGAAYQGVGGASSDNKIKLTDTQSSNNSFTTNFDIDIYDPQNSSRRKLILYRSASWYNHDGSTSNFYWKHHIGAATYRGNTTAFSGVTIYPSSGNFTSGSLSLYGLKL